MFDLNEAPDQSQDPNLSQSRVHSINASTDEPFSGNGRQKQEMDRAEPNIPSPCKSDCPVPPRAQKDAATDLYVDEHWKAPAAVDAPVEAGSTTTELFSSISFTFGDMKIPLLKRENCEPLIYEDVSVYGDVVEGKTDDCDDDMFVGNHPSTSLERDQFGHQTKKVEELLRKNQNFLGQSDCRTQKIEDSHHPSDPQNTRIKSEDVLHGSDHKKTEASMNPLDHQRIKTEELLDRSDDQTKCFLSISDIQTVTMSETSTETQRTVNQEDSGEKIVSASCTFNHSLRMDLTSLSKKISIDPENYSADMLNFALRPKSMLENTNDLNISLSSKAVEPTDLALRKSIETPLKSKQGSGLSPFWIGKLRCFDEDSVIHIPLVALCSGVMKPDCGLKKIPAMLNVQKLVKLEELRNSLLSGVDEPLIQFKTSMDASIEEVTKFKSMIKATTIRIKSPSQLALELGPEVVCAVLISWDDNNSGTKLHLLSSTSLQIMLKNCQLDIFHSAVEKLGVLDPHSLYGVFCGNVPTNKHATTPSFEQKKGRDITTLTSRKSGGITCITSATEKCMTPNTTTTRSRSDDRYHAKEVEILDKSVAKERHASTRDRLGFVHGEETSRKSYQKQSSAGFIANESKSKHSFKDDNRVGSLCREQGDKFNSSHERYFDRHGSQRDKPQDTVRPGKEGRYSSKNQSKDYQQHAYLEGQGISSSRAYEGDRLNHDEGWHKEREKLLKVNKPLELNRKSVEGSKNDIDSLYQSRLETRSTKPTKKRDREEEMLHTDVKRSRESQVNLLESEKAKNSDLDLRSSIDVMNMHHEPRRASKLIGRMVSTNVDTNSHQVDDVEVKQGPTHREIVISKTRDADSHSVKYQMEDTNLKEKRGDNRVLLCGDNSNILQVRGEILEDETTSKLAEALYESPVVIVDKEGKEEPCVEFSVDVLDKETRMWLLSKQNALYLHEDYGVDAVIISEASNTDSHPKADSLNSLLRVRISMATSQSCDATEAMWFIDQAACMIKSVSTRGVFIKCIWYDGPVQLQPGDTAPSVSSVVKKIKGDDGKNLERIQDITGVMVGVVLRKSNTAVQNEIEPMSYPRFIGLRLKCIKRRGLLDASRKAKALLENVAEHFSKEQAMHFTTRVSDLPEPSLHRGGTAPYQDSHSAIATEIKELLPSPPLKSGMEMQFSCSESPTVNGSKFGVLHEDDGKELSKSIYVKEDSNRALPVERNEVPSRSLYVTDIPAHVNAIKIQNIFESVLKEKHKALDDFDRNAQLVVDVKYLPDKLGAVVELANIELVNESLKLFTEDGNIFHGLRVEVSTSAKGRINQPSSIPRSRATNTKNNNRDDAFSPSLVRSESDAHEGRKQYELSDNDSDSDYFRNLFYGTSTASKNDDFLDKPRPLFVSELMRNASAQTIKELFEDIINTYLRPALVSSSGKQLVLDVRYVPSRGCAFVDLATPQLVDFMLDLHSRRPDVFLNMKMELGRRPVSCSIEDDTERRLNSRNWDEKLGKSYDGSQSYGCHLASTSSRRIVQRRSGSHNNYMEDSDTSDDFLRQSSRAKKLRSDPERTIYADRLPESTSEAMLKSIFERVLLQNLSREELEAFGDELITEVRYIPSKYCAFIVFIAEELTKVVLNLYNQNEDAFESMRLKPHFHSRMEDLYKEDLHDTVDDTLHASSCRLRPSNLEVDDKRKIDSYNYRNQSAVHRAITASAFKEVNRRKSVYVDRIPEDLSEYTMTDMFEKAFRSKKHGYEGYMVVQVAYFRDKFDPTKLCAFVELKTEEGTQDLVDFYNADPDAFQGVRVRPGFKYSRREHEALKRGRH